MEGLLMELNEEQLECLRGCSQYTQYYKGRKAFEDGVCPFCIIDKNVNTVLYEGEEEGGWIAWEVPQSFTTRQTTLALQLVFFPKRHVRNPTELTIHERLGRFEVLDWAYEKYSIPGGGIVGRVGDTRYNVGTIMHLHETLMVPNRANEVLIPLQKSPETWQAHHRRMCGFAKRYEAGVVPEHLE